MDFGANKTPIEVIKEGALEVLILEAFILVLMGSCTKSHGKSWIGWKILIRSIIAQVIMMLVLINVVLNVKHRLDFGKIKAGLIK